MLNRIYKVISALIILAISLFAFEVFAFGLLGQKIPKNINYEILNNEFRPHSQLTSNQSSALLALEAKIRGYSSKKIKKKLGISIPDTLFPGSEIFTKPLTVDEVALANTASESDMAGFMRFTDETGRHATFWFDLTIDAKEKSSSVNIQALELVTQSNTEIELFLIPEDAINTSTIYAAKDYSKLYKEISSIATKINHTTVTGLQKYIAVAFYKELIAPNMSINMKLTDMQEGTSGQADESHYKLVEDAWLVTILPLHLDLARDKRWIKITAQAKTDAYNSDLSEEHVIGLFPLSI